MKKKAGSKGQQTQEKILSVAQDLILQKGFSGTSIDEIIEKAGITKGGFFYHFDGKNELARRLLKRYLQQDEIFFNGLFDRADSLSEDPLQQMLIFLKLFAEAMADLKSTHPGCLVASYTYERQQFDSAIRQLAADGVHSWQKLFKSRFEKITDQYAMKIEVSSSDLADMLNSIIEGGIILSRVFDNEHMLSRQLLQFRTHIRLLFDVI